MTCLQFTLSLSGTAPAQPTLPQPLTAQAWLEVEHDVGRPNAAEIEYASWMPDPGAIEFASWAAHMRALAR